MGTVVAKQKGEKVDLVSAAPLKNHSALMVIANVPVVESSKNHQCLIFSDPDQQRQNDNIGSRSPAVTNWLSEV